jgi:hypothetical protein
MKISARGAIAAERCAVSRCRAMGDAAADSLTAAPEKGDCNNA